MKKNSALIIDAFSHFIPKETLDAFGKASQATASSLIKTLSNPDMAHVYDLKVHENAMKKLGIDVQVVSVPQVVSGYVRGQDEVRVCSASNDALARVIEKSEGRLIGAANLPMSIPSEATEELKRSVEEIGMRAVQIYSNIGGKPIDLPEFLPIFERAQHYDIPILLHPTDTVSHDWFKEFRLNQIFGWPFDTSLAMGRIIFSGILEKYPNLKIIAHHSGAMIPFFSERISGFHEPTEFVRADSQIGATTLQKVPYFKRFYADTAVYGSTAALMCAYSFFGVEHIVYGSDYPFGPEKGEKWAASGIRSVREMPISEDQKELIFEKNSRSLFKIK